MKDLCFCGSSSLRCSVALSHCSAATCPPRSRQGSLSVQALVAVAFLLFIVFVSNPFERLSPVPVEGRGLNPLLQDPALAFHPPFLYAGYVGLSVAFSFALAALIEGRVDAAWARWVRPWTTGVPGCSSPLASPWAHGGPIMNSVGVVGGSGIPLKMRASCHGSSRRRSSTRQSWWRSATP